MLRNGPKGGAPLEQPHQIVGKSRTADTCLLPPDAAPSAVVSTFQTQAPVIEIKPAKG
jgi:hypothetical protein